MATINEQPPKLALPHLSLDLSILSLFPSPGRALPSPKGLALTDEQQTQVGTERLPTPNGSSERHGLPTTSILPSSDYSPRHPEKPAMVYGQQPPVRSPRPRPLLKISTSPLNQSPLFPGTEPLISSPSSTPLASAPLPSAQRLGLPSPRRPSLHTSASFTTLPSAPLHGEQRLRPQRSNLNISSSYTSPLSASPPCEQRLGVPAQQKPLLNRWSDSNTSSFDSHSSQGRCDSRSSDDTSVSIESSRSKGLASPPLDPLPENGSPVPVLWTMDAYSKYAVGYRQLVSKLGFILYDAHFTRPQFGLFRAGENPDFNRNPEVIAILLEPQDVGKWQQVDKQIYRLGTAYFQGSVGVPPVRYWLKRGYPQSPHICERESWLGKPVILEAKSPSVSVGRARRSISVGKEVIVDAKSLMQKPVVVEHSADVPGPPLVGSERASVQNMEV